jgi:hypothetical protein
MNSVAGNQLQVTLNQVANTEGWLTLQEAKLLYKVARLIDEGCIVEIGCYRGRSTVALGSAVLDKPDVSVYALDPHSSFTGECGGEFGPEDRGEFFRTMLNSGCYKTVHLINLSSEVVTPGWTEDVSFLWIDGDHSLEGIKRDVECWMPHLSECAYLAFHDTTKPNLGPHVMVNQLLGSGQFQEVGRVDSITLLQK